MVVRRKETGRGAERRKEGCREKKMEEKKEKKKDRERRRRRRRKRRGGEKEVSPRLAFFWLWLSFYGDRWEISI